MPVDNHNVRSKPFAAEAEPARNSAALLFVVLREGRLERGLVFPLHRDAGRSSFEVKIRNEINPGLTHDLMEPIHRFRMMFTSGSVHVAYSRNDIATMLSSARRTGEVVERGGVLPEDLLLDRLGLGGQVRC